MSLEKFKEMGLLFNSNFMEKTSDDSISGYRGELVLIEGEVGDTKGHVKPPIEVMRGVVLLADEKLKLVVGAIDQLESLTTFSEKYKKYFDESMIAVLFVVNITEPMQVDVEGINFVLIPLVQGMPWNEIIDELALEKSDFKGQTPANKIVTLYEELKNYSPKYSTVSLDKALASTADIVRESYGAV